MKTNSKFSIVDPRLRNALVGAVGQDYGSVLENIVILELIRKGFPVPVGIGQEFEIVFTAEKTLLPSLCFSYGRNYERMCDTFLQSPER